MFVTPAYAQAAGGAAGGGDFITGILPLVLIFAVFYFLLIRPQQKRMKAHKAKVNAVRRGDKVVTGGGILATVTKVTDEELQIEVAKGVRLRVVKSTLSEVLSSTQPVPANDDGARGKAQDRPSIGQSALSVLGLGRRNKAADTDTGHDAAGHDDTGNDDENGDDAGNDDPGNDHDSGDGDRNEDRS